MVISRIDYIKKSFGVRTECRGIKDLGSHLQNSIKHKEVPSMKKLAFFVMRLGEAWGSKLHYTLCLIQNKRALGLKIRGRDTGT